MVFLDQNHPNPDTPKPMRYLTTLIVALMLGISSNAQQFDLRGKEAVATSYTRNTKFLRATLPNAATFHTESFAFIRGEKQAQMLVFVCRTTPTEVYFTSVDVGEDFPLNFQVGEKLIACPVTDDQYLKHFNVDHRGLCEQCKVPTASL